MQGRDFGINWTHPKVPNFVGDNIEIEINLITRAIDVEEHSNIESCNTGHYRRTMVALGLDSAIARASTSAQSSATTARQ